MKYMNNISQNLLVSDEEFTRQRPVSEEFSRPRPSEQNFSRQRPSAARRPPTEASFDPTEFEPQRQQQQSGGRQRLEVTEIKVRPQLASQEFNQESLNIDAFRQVANRFRQRGSQQQ